VNHVLMFLLPTQIRAEQLAKEGWEYSPVFTMKFHAKERKMDLVRRRRWHRKMVQDDPSAPAVFHIDVGSSDDVRIRSYYTKVSLKRQVIKAHSVNPSTFILDFPLPLVTRLDVTPVRA